MYSLNYSAETAALKNLAKELILLTSEAYRTLVQHVDAHATLAPSEGYISLINHLNENIEYFTRL